MVSMTFTGKNFQEMVEQVEEFVDSIKNASINDQQAHVRASMGEPNTDTENNVDGYRPQGVGRPKYGPVDDGTEWTEEALEEWLERLSPLGRTVVGTLSRGGTIDPRLEAKALNWYGPYWAGVWTGPRKQASVVMEIHQIGSWPYGHTYVEPRRLWIHPEIANKVLKLLDEGDWDQER